MKNKKSQSVLMVSDQGDNSQKKGDCSQKKKFFSQNKAGKKYFKEGNHEKSGSHNANTSATGTKNERFKGNCNFCHKYGHNKVDCRKFKAWLDKKGIQKPKESN
ncbi:hypothetical protein L484_012672 [Morus notabilis]|uniref:CCHC-type domain-containing protein n=1 Tax=Morus notabilis TaxID=981085 RepID=W9QD55_9ROSA|nr:hypothetical protein L484_012672 [Morus notabilis]